MGGAKDLVVKVIPVKVAREFVKKHHYSGTFCQNSSLHFGVFYNGVLHGVMQFGPPLDRRKVLGLVVDSNGEQTPWNSVIELNRMAFDDVLPRNSESRAISVAIRLIRKNAPQIKWIISFADGCQCGDGTIYRASGFALTGFSCGSMWRLPPELERLNGGSVAHRMKIQNKCSPISKFVLSRTGGKNISIRQCAELFGGEVLDGYMLRYIKILDKQYKLAVPKLDFSEIEKRNAGMYMGKKK